MISNSGNMAAMMATHAQNGIAPPIAQTVTLQCCWGLFQRRAKSLTRSNVESAVSLPWNDKGKEHGHAQVAASWDIRYKSVRRRRELLLKSYSCQWDWSPEAFGCVQLLDWEPDDCSAFVAAGGGSSYLPVLHPAISLTGLDPLHWFVYSGNEKRCLVTKLAGWKYRKLVKNHFVNFPQMISVSSQRRGGKRAAALVFPPPLGCNFISGKPPGMFTPCQPHLAKKANETHMPQSVFLPSLFLCHVNLFLTKSASFV